MVGSPRGVDVNRAGCPDPVQVQLLAAGRMGIQDRLSRWKVLQLRQGMRLSTDSPEEEGRSSPSMIGDQPGLLSVCISKSPAFHEMCDPEAVPIRKVWFKDQM